MPIFHLNDVLQAGLSLPLYFLGYSLDIFPSRAEFLGLSAFLRECEVLLRSSETWVFGIYYASLGALSLYALHRLHLLFLLWSAHPKPNPSDSDTCSFSNNSATATGMSASSQPLRRTGPIAPPRTVTVQLPIYNEHSVAGRLIDAVAALDYPAEQLQVQVLDDSTDETSSVIAQRVAHWQEHGLDIQHLRRTERTGYKAGALAAALPAASGALIAIFDADFVPAPDFLQRTVPHFEDTSIGMVQARWDHLNRDASLLTRVQALLLDGHFLVEHAARHRSRRLFNFNGTAGIWRREAIEDGGGWQHDTLTEDLDLSYRSQLAGWQFRFLPNIGVPAELPDNLSAYRGQQRRWTLGSAQTLRKLAFTVLRSSLSRGQKAEAIAHLSANLGYPLTVIVAVLLPLVVYLRHLGAEPGLLWVDLSLLASGTLALCTFYLAAARTRGHGLLATLVLMPALLSLCMGLCWHNAKATIAGLFLKGGEFERTPKQGTSSASRTPLHYRRKRRFPWGESILALYLGCATLFLAASGAFLGLPFLLLFLCGFSSSAAVLWRKKKSRAAPKASTEPAIASSGESSLAPP